MSVLITAVMLLQMVGIVGQASPADIVLETVSDGAVADDVTYSGSLKTTFVPNGGMVDWATQGAIQLNSASPWVQWEFDVPVGGSYNIYVAYANNASTTMTAYKVTDEKDIDISSAITLNVYPNEGGSISGNNMVLYPNVTKLADCVNFAQGTHKLKIKANAGAVYNVKLEYASATDSIVLADSYLNGGNVGGYGNSAGAASPENGFYNKAGGFLSGGNTNVSYEVEIFETGTYVFKFTGSKYASGYGDIDFYDSVDGGSEQKILSGFQIAKGSTEPLNVVTNVSTVQQLTAGTHIFRVDGSGYGYFNGFKVEKVAPLAVSTVTANTSAAALSNNNTVSKGADTFAVKFSNEVIPASVTDATIGLYDGDTVLGTYKDIADDTVYLTVKKALDAEKTYTIKVNGVYDEYTSIVSGYALNVVTDADGSAVSSLTDEITAANKTIESAADENKRDVTVTGKILSSKGTPIEGRAVSLKLAGETVWTGTSGVDGVVLAKYEIPLAVADSTLNYTFTLTGDGVTTDRTVTLTYVSAAQEIVILGQLANADTAEDVKAFIENPEYQAMFEINPSTDMPAYTDFDENLVYGQLTNLVVSDVRDFKDTYKKAILLETINQAGAADAESSVTAILASSDDCALLGIDKAKLDYVEGASLDNLVDAICALNVNDPAKTFEEELDALAQAIDVAIDEALRVQYSKTGATSLAASTVSVYAGQSFNISLDVTPAQDNLEKVEYTIEASDETMIEDSVVTTEYDYETAIVDGKLVITVTLPEAEATALSADVEIGTVSISTPNTSGSYTVNLNGKMSFNEGIPYAIVTSIAPVTITVTTTKNSSTGSYVQSSTPVTGTASKPTTSNKEDTEPDTKTPVEEEKVSNFTDLAGNEWAVEAIDTLYDKGIISDNEQKIFRPNDNVTREEFVKMIIEALGLIHETYETDLKDVEEGAWYYPYVATAVEKGIVLGDENGYFHVGENISRQDMAVIIIRVLTKLEHPYETKSTKFTDDAQISDYAKDAMYAAKNLAIINGVGDNMCAPKGTATRAMAAKVIYEMMRTVGL